MFDWAKEPGLVEAAKVFVTRAVSLDVSAMTGADAAKLVPVLDRVIRVASAKRLDAMRRVEQTGAYRNEGDRSAADWAARKAGTTVGQAQKELALAERLDQAPATKDKLARGEVSVDQAEQVSRAAAADPSSEERLLDAASRRSLPELKNEAARVVAAATDAEERQRRIRANRHLRTWTDTDGAFRLSGSLTPDAGAVFLSALRPFEQAAFDQARREGRHEDHDRYAADALVALSRSTLTRRNGQTNEEESTSDRSTNDGSLFADSAPTPQRGRAEMILLVDLAALRRGQLEPGETCEIPGIGTVPISLAEEVLGTALLTLIVRDGTDIRTVAHTGRSPSADQRRALLVRDPVCAIEGCGRRLGLEIDHNEPWAQGGQTILPNLARLCRFHHRLKTQGWELHGPPGHMTLRPPNTAEQPRAG